MIIKNGYTDSKKEEYNNIRNINFDSKEDMSNNLGKYISQTEHNDGMWFDTDSNLLDGVFLYKTKYDDNKALRIYKDTVGCFDNYKYTAYNDHKIISELLSRQKHIKLTDFPTGIVTIENYVVGQEIPFYENSKTLAEIIDLKSTKEIIEYYKKIIDILEELCNNGIIYSDVHARNFMVNSCNNLLKLIDFDKKYLGFDTKNFLYNEMIYNLRNMINYINTKKNIYFEIKEEETLEDIKETIMKKLV